VPTLQHATLQLHYKQIAKHPIYDFLFALQSALCAFQWASWHDSPQYRACLQPVHFMSLALLQPVLEQCVLTCRYAV
jgi:hypothetical protein